MKSKVFILITLIFSLVFTTPIQSLANGMDSYIYIVVIGEGRTCRYIESDVEAFLKDGRTLAPLRAIAETFKFDVEWDGINQAVTISKDDKKIELWIGKTEAGVNGATINMPVAPEILDDRTMVPVRFVSEYMGINVEWQQGIDNNSFVYLSPFALLNDEDVEPNYNYHRLDEDVPYYVLNDDGTTARGIKIGDEYEKVIEKYGKPHEISNSDAWQYINYFTPCLPNTDDGSMLIFWFENGKVISVEIDT